VINPVATYNTSKITKNQQIGNVYESDLVISESR